eukprot:2239540-Rhodomonas_salina.1
MRTCGCAAEQCPTLTSISGPEISGRAGRGAACNAAGPGQLTYLCTRRSAMSDTDSAYQVMNILEGIDPHGH